MLGHFAVGASPVAGEEQAEPKPQRRAAGFGFGAWGSAPSFSTPSDPEPPAQPATRGEG